MGEGSSCSDELPRWTEWNRLAGQVWAPSDLPVELPSLSSVLSESPRASSGFSQYGCFLGSASLSVKKIRMPPGLPIGSPTHPPFSTVRIRCHRFLTLRRVSLGVVLCTLHYLSCPFTTRMPTCNNARIKRRFFPCDVLPLYGSSVRVASV